MHELQSLFFDVIKAITVHYSLKQILKSGLCLENLAQLGITGMIAANQPFFEHSLVSP
jgi:hypothetical protein